MFGLGFDRAQNITIFQDFQLNITPGQIILITGPSGGGKTLLLKHIIKHIESSLDDSPLKPLHHQTPPSDQNQTTTIDTFHCSTQQALHALSIAGLNDPPAMLRLPTQLSDGQQWRLTLAHAIAETPATIILDEFCSTLDRQTAKAVAFNVRKTATRTKTTFILATAHTDIIQDLNPDTIILKHAGPKAVVINSPTKTDPLKPCSLLTGITISQGTTQDWHTLSSFHYRGKRLGPTAKIFKMLWTDPASPDLLSKTLVGVIVYAYAALSLRARTIAAPNIFKPLGRYKLPPGKWINKTIKNISRVVIHPNWRGIGLATLLVRHTLPLSQSPYVETSAAMARINPFFQRAGMTPYKTPPRPDSSALIKLLSHYKITPKEINQPSRLIGTLTTLPPKISQTLSRKIVSWAHKYLGFRRHPSPRAALLFAAQTAAHHLLTQPIYFLWKNPNLKPPENPIDSAQKTNTLETLTPANAPEHTK